MPSAALSTVAPASSARRATSGRHVSTLTSTPSAASAGTIGSSRSHSTFQSTTVGDVGRALPAEVDAVGAVGRAAAGARATAASRRRDDRIGVQRVGAGVDDAEQLHDGDASDGVHDE